MTILDPRASCKCKLFFNVFISSDIKEDVLGHRHQGVLDLSCMVLFFMQLSLQRDKETHILREIPEDSEKIAIQ